MSASCLIIDDMHTLLYHLLRLSILMDHLLSRMRMACVVILSGLGCPSEYHVHLRCLLC
jgi:hypothetical protein